MNDEVKLILKKLKIVSEEKENGAYICDKEHSKLLLSYIEQLEKDNDALIKLVKVDEEKLSKASNTINKAIEEINYLISNCDISDYQGEKIMNILKGDSDE